MSDDNLADRTWCEWGEGVVCPSENINSIWIYIDGPDYNRGMKELHCKLWRQGEELHILELDDKGNIVNSEIYGLSKSNIDFIANKYGILSGKWLVFRPPEFIDDTWNQVALAVTKGKLGTSAKVASARNKSLAKKGSHVICIYTYDYRDEKDVMRVRKELRALGIDEVIYYKPDIYTYFGIYSGRTSIKASTYSS